MGISDRVTKLFRSENKTTDLGIYSAPYDGELAESAGHRIFDSTTPLGVKTTPEMKRVSPEELEAAYMSEPTSFNAINKTTQLLMAAGYHLVGDKKSVNFFYDFFDSIGTRGGEIEWQELLTSIFKHQMIYGEAWNEKIPAKRDSNRIVDLDLIDPKKMSYAKDGNEKIVLDKYGDPVGYVETLPYDYTATKTDKPPKGVSIQSNQVFFYPNRVAHYKLYTAGDAFYGIGLIEPSYKAIVRKLNMEEALANAVNRTGFPIRWAKIGDMNHEPTTELMTRTVDQLKDMNYMGVIGYPYWVDSGIIEAKHPEKLQEHLNYYTDQIITGTGMPKALVTGMGEETNRATLGRQEAITKITLKDIVRRTLRVVHKQVIKPVAESNNVNPVRIVWGEISIEELNERAKRLLSYQKAGLLTPDENIETFIREIEDLPKRDRNAERRTEDKPDKSKIE